MLYFAAGSTPRAVGTAIRATILAVHANGHEGLRDGAPGGLQRLAVRPPKDGR